MYYKVLTHDYRSPVRGGAPVFDGTLPYTLPAVMLDIGPSECDEGATGWYFSSDLATALRIARLWPNGRPSSVFEVEPGSDAIQRGDKWRASAPTLVRRLNEDEVREGVRALSSSFAPHVEAMVVEQMAWREALARPLRDEAAVEAGLRAALAARRLEWGLQRYNNAWDAWAPTAAWDAWDAWAPTAAMDAMDAWEARDARGARDAWDARDALTVRYAALQGWTATRLDLLTTGIRDAYRNGLAVAVPTGVNELVWAMVGDPAQAQG